MTQDQPDASPLVCYLRKFYVDKGSPTLRAVAGRTGVSRSAVHKILTGQCVPTPAKLHALVAYLGADQDTARALADKSKPERPAPVTRRASLRDVCEELATLRRAIEELTHVLRQAG